MRAMDVECHEGLIRRSPCAAITCQRHSLIGFDGRLQAARLSGPRSDPDAASSGPKLKAPGSAGGYLLMGSGCLAVVAGMLQLFCKALEVRRAKGRRLHAELNLRHWSLRSTSLALMMIAIGALLLAGGHFVAQ
jgi:hypothetical protein